MNYVLITPERNEEALIEKTLQSVIAQPAPPERWVIVDDGSSDRTAEIVERYAKGHPWIELLRRSPRKDRTFAGKVAAVNAGLERVQSLEFEGLGNLDADVSFEADYMSFFMQKFWSSTTWASAGQPLLHP